tara:strand:- start:138 stop:302 length:165 start_codon:yes stop_codon:yes gene_type:complete
VFQPIFFQVDGEIPLDGSGTVHLLLEYNKHSQPKQDIGRGRVIIKFIYKLLDDF